MKNLAKPLLFEFKKNIKRHHDYAFHSEIFYISLRNTLKDGMFSL